MKLHACVSLSCDNSAQVNIIKLSDSGSHGHMHASGLNIPFAAFFIVGEIAGSGVLALPKAVDDTGWIGLVLLVACALLSAYTGSILGKSWVIIQERFPEYRQSCPDPYPVLGEKTFGKKGRYVVSFSINFTQFGVSVVFLLLASENVEDLVEKWSGTDLSFCIWLIILAGIICPLTWFGTPADFWPVAVGATVATAIACILLLVKVARDQGLYDPVLHSTVEFEPFFMAFGTIVFAFGGHPGFPTFQTSMKRPGDFKWAVLLGYLVVLAMYLPISTVAYVIYGKNVAANILLMKGGGVVNQMVEVLITLHLVLGFLIVINVFCQEMESYARVPRHFTWKRCVFRTLVVVLILFVAETIPKFGAILSLVGGSTVTILAYICPSLIYLKLKAVRHEDMIQIVNGHSGDVVPEASQGLPLWVKVMNIEIIVLGTVAGIASTYSAIKAIISSDFSKPCYV
uniref:Amino acid transporter AVT1J-like isoform X1 n=1 Tax=Crassostrea virginica TaxID=6565 RepID=A0A8B8APS7_CRAVI|nr:amino acid transporter AVT1J-like isoform X1 [Crassostrea virginica]